MHHDPTAAMTHDILQSLVDAQGLQGMQSASQPDLPDTMPPPSWQPLLPTASGMSVPQLPGIHMPMQLANMAHHYGHFQHQLPKPEPPVLRQDAYATAVVHTIANHVVSLQKQLNQETEARLKAQAELGSRRSPRGRRRDRSDSRGRLQLAGRAESDPKRRRPVRSPTPSPSRKRPTRPRSPTPRSRRHTSYHSQSHHDTTPARSVSPPNPQG